MFEMASLLLLLQNMLLEIEEKVLTLSELSMHSENLLLEGRTETKEEAEQLTRKLHTLKGSLFELQRMLQDKQINIQVRGLHVSNVDIQYTHVCAHDAELFTISHDVGFGSHYGYSQISQKHFPTSHVTLSF